VACGGGQQNPNYSGTAWMVPGIGGTVTVTYGGAAVPPVIGRNGHPGNPPPNVQVFTVGGSDPWYSGSGPGAPGYPLGNVVTNWGAGGQGGDATASVGASAGVNGVVALIY
jgi:hypothetical protein